MIIDGRYWLWRRGWGARCLVEVRDGRVRRFPGEYHPRSVEQYDDCDFGDRIPYGDAAYCVQLNSFRLVNPITGEMYEP